MPPDSDDIPKRFELRKLNKFDINFEDMTFDSDLGKGRVKMSEDNHLTITFFDVESHINDQLVLNYQGSINH